MGVVLGSGIVYTSPNPVCISCSTNTLDKIMNPIIFPSIYKQILGQTDLFNCVKVQSV